MQKLWIFGDSYAANERDESYAWPKRLSEKYDIKNWASGGTGPEYMINLFRKELDSPTLNLEDLADINLIFFLSHDSRKDFSFLKEPVDQCFMLHTALETDFKDKWSRKRAKQYKREQQFITQFYRDYYLHNNLCDFNHLAYIGIIKEFSRFFKKVLVVSVFDNLDLLPKFNATIKDLENFCYARGPALFFVEKEINGDMPNHLCIENHNNMYSQLVDWVEHSTPFDTKKLKEIS